MGRQKWFLALLVMVLVIIFLYNKTTQNHNQGTFRRPETEIRGGKTDQQGPAETDARGGLNRNAQSLIYSKHARCRMGCRHISEREVMEILKNGTINYQKSDMRGQPDPKYALEGPTDDGQHVRIIFANSPRGIVVVTVIDLENEWKCNCK
jgi:hypothetical protein